MSTNSPLRVAPLVLGLALSACGGSGGSGDDTPPNDLALIPDNAAEGSTTGIADDGLPGGGAGSPGNVTALPPVADPDDCSVVAQNQWVDAAMRDYYLYYDQVPEVDPASYASPEALLSELIVNPPDRFSVLADREPFTNLFQAEGTRYGFGFRLVRVAADDLRILSVDAESPAAAAGIRRGEHLLMVNGESADSLISNEDYTAVFGTASSGDARSATLTLEDIDGEQRTVSASTAGYPAISAPLREVFDNAETGQRVGYIVFDEFLDAAAEEIAAYLAEFDAERIDELIIDLRYNAGGLVNEALSIGTQIGGQGVAGQVAESVQYNDKYADQFNQDVLFPQVAATIELPRLIFLTSDESASASELLINSLKPYKEVVVIGTGNTFGKAAAFRANPRCDKLLFAVESTSVNSVGESVENGIPPDCVTRDTVERELGDPQESMLADALQFVLDGSCAAPGTTLASARQRQRHVPIGPQPLPMAIIE